MSNKRLICSKHSRHVTGQSRARWRLSVDFLCLNHRHHQLKNMKMSKNNRVSHAGRDMIKKGLGQEGTRHGGIVSEISGGRNLPFFATSNSEWATDIIKWAGYMERWRRTSTTHTRSILISSDDSEIRLFVIDGCPRCRIPFAPPLLSFGGGLVCNY